MHQPAYKHHLTCCSPGGELPLDSLTAMELRHLSKTLLHPLQAATVPKHKTVQHSLVTAILVTTTIML